MEHDFSLTDLVIASVGVIVSMASLTILCCLCMKISDMRLKCHILETATKKGLEVDLETLNSKARCPKDETCAIMVPDFSFIV